MLPDIADKMIKTFLTDYSYRPNDNELQALTDWAVAIDEEMLKQVLNPEYHPVSSSGKRLRPNLADLKIAINDIRRDRGDFRRQEDQSLIDDEECFYCLNGRVYAVDCRNDVWSDAIIGLCRHCRAGQKSSSLFKPVEPQSRVIDSARDWGLTCPDAVDRLVKEHNEQFRKPEEPAKGDLKESPKHEGPNAGTEIIAEQPIKAGVPMADGFVPDSDIPF